MLLVVACGCNFEVEPPARKPPVAARLAPARIEKIEARHLPNPVRVHERVISGGLPERDEAFAELQKLGIKTVISVDGAKPDVALAEKYGMRYIHLPHGYDGIPEQRAKELAKAVRDLPGPIYIHCHHGKHRSPAATAVACVGAGLIGRGDAAVVLQVAGTSEAYRGLYASAKEAHPLDKALLDELQAEFPAVAKLPAMAEAMVAIEHVYDRLKAIEKAGWQTPANQPDLVPAHEALLLREQFTELLRTKELREKPAKFQQLTREAEAASQALEDALNAAADASSASQLLLAVSDNCKTCHQAFRDVPLQEKGGGER
jgi:protein tyrosine phosphatase (PTP) superfamily phosphohydrolase (DUF442 family)